MMGVCFARFYSIFDVLDIEPAEEHVLALDWGDVNSLASAAALSSDSIWESLVSTEERLKHRNCPASPTSEPIAPKRQHFSLNENDEMDERRDVQFAKSVLDADSPKKKSNEGFSRVLSIVVAAGLWRW